ncbi:nucleotidyltransferase domain-containing protein [Pseudanabaena sp. FACHB-2040]|uniref:nucleotidyltransferase family protein n=1 Tax=Pseudanabaena sp. FACHB-2040 TaxID=2692859 RepID=UPI0016839D33|nr:nucleotidyltransferase domain-containing protein [Pseudanabaena sp. FACHB-2040]MBD2258829.1 nucleotidyltransferase domain-containing protein [Pseudanabaena sp. FACHB-2040]
MQHPQLTEILDQLQAYLKNLYSERLERLMLFGSRAHQEAEPDSDIDVMVVLKGEIDPWIEIERTGEFISDLCLTYSVVICNVFVSASRYQSQGNALIRNVYQEGGPL